MPPGPGRRGRIALDFTKLSWAYWLGIYPHVSRELAAWRARAALIPDATLRAHALDAHRDKRRHAEGAAAFAVIAPPARRLEVVRCLVAFQAMYDYLDTISEQSGRDPLRNSWQLHGALIDALSPGTRRSSPYALHPHRDDGGYLAA